MNDPWLSLCTELPLPGELVWWYDAGFHRLMHFAMDNPAGHDGDFTHFSYYYCSEAPLKYRRKEPPEFNSTNQALVDDLQDLDKTRAELKIMDVSDEIINASWKRIDENYTFKS